MTWQPHAVAAVDAELLLTGLARPALRTALADNNLHVSNSVPNPRRPRMVTFRRDGGARDGVFDRPRMAVNCWGSSDQDAADIARKTIAVLLELVGEGGITRVYNFAGPLAIEDAQPRKFFTFDADIRI